MSNLQMSLIAIGALIIVSVIVINWWQERRFRRQVQDSFSPIKNDVLLDEIDLTTPRKTDDLYNVLNKQATHDFAIDTALVEASKEPSFYDDENRFVKLSQSLNDEAVPPTETSIDAAYNELMKAKLERSSLQKPATDDATTPNTDANAIKPDEINEIFTNTHITADLAPQIDAPASLAAESNEVELELLPATLHGQMDLTAVLYLADKTSVAVINDKIKSLFDGFDKPIFVHVLYVNNRWNLLREVCASDELISKVACSIQLADRGGPISRNTLNRFQLAVETLGLAINGHVEWQSTDDALAKANELDQFCIEVDKTIGFHLLQGESGAFTGTKLRGMAEAQGFMLSADGQFAYIAQEVSESQTHPSFVMFNRDNYPFSPEMLRNSVVKAVTFQLDIPHVKQSSEVFSQMVQVAKQMEVGLQAMLVDDNNKMLGDIQIEKIRQQLKVIQTAMLVRGIIPGSDSAHRLFS